MKRKTESAFGNGSSRRGGGARPILVTILAIIVLLILAGVAAFVAIDFGLWSPPTRGYSITLPDSQFPK